MILSSSIILRAGGLNLILPEKRARVLKHPVSFNLFLRSSLGNFPRLLASRFPPCQKIVRWREHAGPSLSPRSGDTSWGESGVREPRAPNFPNLEKKCRAFYNPQGAFYHFKRQTVVGMSNLQSMGHVSPRIDMNLAQHICKQQYFATLWKVGCLEGWNEMLRSWEYLLSEDVKRTQQMTSDSQLQQTQKQEQDCWHLPVSIHDLFLERTSVQTFMIPHSSEKKRTFGETRNSKGFTSTFRDEGEQKRLCLPGSNYGNICVLCVLRCWSSPQGTWVLWVPPPLGS